MNIKKRFFKKQAFENVVCNSYGHHYGGQESINDGSTECLIHPSLNKMASISQTMFADEFSWLKKKCISIKI